MAPLHEECNALRNVGINPSELINIARYLQLPEMVSKAFPQMPFHMRDDVMAGNTDIKLVDNAWTRVDAAQEDYVYDHSEHESDLAIDANPDLYMND